MRFSTCLGVVTLAVLGACSTDSFNGNDGGDATSDAVNDNVISGGDGGSGDGHPSDAITPSRFCDDVKAAFCADFDIPNDANAGFNLAFAPPYLVRDEILVVKSAPVSLAVDIPADAAGGIATATAFLPGATTNPSSMTLSLDLYLPAIENGTPAIFAFEFGVPPPEARFGLAQTGGRWSFMNTPSKAYQFAPSDPPTGKWVHAMLTIPLNLNGIATCTIDGNVASALPIDTTGLDGGAGMYTTLLQLGVSRPNTMPPGTTPQSVRYDNVVITLQ
jgi:hypothetical protein